MRFREWKEVLEGDAFARALFPLYQDHVKENLARYEHLLDLFRDSFGDAPERELALFSAPGRTEIGGNHTDHQHGRVLAASVDMDMIAAASVTEDGMISILSEGYPLCRIAVDDLTVHEEEKNSTAALIRGVAAAFAERGCALKGFQAAVTSNVLPGSGISSSAAFEVLIGNIINGLFYDGRASAVEIAQIGQIAENVYFGKPSGLMDQMASSVGNILTIDFEKPSEPVVQQLDVDFAKSGLALCIIDSGADHADLTDEYAAIPAEMKKVCSVFGKQVLREIPQEAFFARLPEVRKAAGDRAVLRAIHFYQDHARVAEQASALAKGDIASFLRLVRASGTSSFMYLQNIVPCGAVLHQEMGVALALCDTLLDGSGAYRVHGGGFAGTVQAFVPLEMLASFREKVEETLGKGCCHVLQIRPAGGMQIIV